MTKTEEAETAQFQLELYPEQAEPIREPIGFGSLDLRLGDCMEVMAGFPDGYKPPGAEYFEELRRVSKHQIIWGANYYPEHLKASMGWIFWDKGQRICNSDGELAYSSFERALRVIEMNRVELLKEGTIHPTQKPVKLYKWLLMNYAKPGQRVLDTHLGSGSHAIAAHYAGIHLTACEIDPEYFDAAKARITRETAQTELFPPMGAR